MKAVCDGGGGRAEAGDQKNPTLICIQNMDGRAAAAAAVAKKKKKKE